MVRDNFQNSACESLQRLRFQVFVAQLCLIEGVSNMALDRVGESGQNATSVANEDQVFHLQFRSVTSMPDLACGVKRG